MKDVKGGPGPSVVLPKNLEAERYLLATVIFDPSKISEILEILGTDPENAFYSERNRTIFQCILDMYMEGEPIDAITIEEKLRKTGKLEKAGGTSYLAELLSISPSLSMATHYAKILKEKKIVRQLILTCSEIIREATREPEDVDEFVDSAEQKIFNVTQQSVSAMFATAREVVTEVNEIVEKIYERDREALSGVPTGFYSLDEMTGGLQPSELIIVAARPGMGKTSFCLNIAYNVAVRERLPVAIFSLEMTRVQLIQRMICAASKIDFHLLRKGLVSMNELSKFLREAGRIAQAPIFINDSSSVSPLEIRAGARRLKAEYDVKLIIIDYLQLIRPYKRFDSREQEVAYISRSLKSLAKELEIPVIAVSQLNRAIERRGSKKPTRPMLSDLRESGAIEQDADVIMFIHQERGENEEPCTCPPHEECTCGRRVLENLVEIDVKKNRNGPMGMFHLVFLRRFTTFENPAPSMDVPVSPEI